MRVIGGIARGRRLEAPPGREVRPTADRVREALFNILVADVPGARFLDLYAGSGAVGIEALSRGARSVTFVERDPRHAAVLDRNLAACGLQGGARVLEMAVREALRALVREGARFDVAFLDPPYEASEERERALREVARGRLLAGEGRIVVEGPSRAAAPEVAGIALERRSRYGEAALAFYRAGPGSRKSP